ncbi:hypothetical protein [Sphingomonas mali]|uniref:hypothetical protein n=1 Tax=Sphingomonas mali TaxID=40682 RepID=UPI000832916F|nr:hypothetical protein [Sphingomonas mali]
MTYLASFAAILLASSVAAPAAARDQVPLTVQRDGTRVTVVSASVERQGRIVTALVRFTPTTGAAAWTSLISVDCKAATIFAMRQPGGMEARPTGLRPAGAAYHSIKQGSVGNLFAAAFCPSRVPNDISVASVGGGPAMPVQIDTRR